MVCAKSRIVEMNLVAVVAGIIAEGGPAVELQLDTVARRAGFASRYVLREPKHRADNGNIVENEQDSPKPGSHNLLPIGIACESQMR